MKDNKQNKENNFWRKAILPDSATIGQVISNLNETAMQITLIISKDEVLLGTITDGDIRRGLSRGLDIHSPISKIVKREPLVVTQSLGRDEVLQLMKANRIHHLPVIDDARRIVDLHILDELIMPENRSNLMVIMCGGQGTRLRPHTESCPKPLLSVGGKPILEHIIERAISEGFQHFILAVNYLSNMIEDYFEDGGRWQIEIEYLKEKKPMGTVGAISLLSPRPDLPFLVTNGDVLTDIKYGELLDFHERHDATATMAVRIQEWQNPFGVVHTNGVDILGFEEKPISYSHINAGIYVLEPTVFNELGQDEKCDMPTLFDRLNKREDKTIVYPMHEPWLDVGSPDDLEKAQKYS